MINYVKIAFQTPRYHSVEGSVGGYTWTYYVYDYISNPDLSVSHIYDYKTLCTSDEIFDVDLSDEQNIILNGFQYEPRTLKFKMKTPSTWTSYSFPKETSYNSTVTNLVVPESNVITDNLSLIKALSKNDIYSMQVLAYSKVSTVDTSEYQLVFAGIINGVNCEADGVDIEFECMEHLGNIDWEQEIKFNLILKSITRGPANIFQIIIRYANRCSFHARGQHIFKDFSLNVGLEEIAAPFELKFLTEYALQTPMYEYGSIKTINNPTETYYDGYHHRLKSMYYCIMNFEYINEDYTPFMLSDYITNKEIYYKQDWAVNDTVVMDVRPDGDLGAYIWTSGNTIYVFMKWYTWVSDGEDPVTWTKKWERVCWEISGKTMNINNTITVPGSNAERIISYDNGDDDHANANNKNHKEWTSKEYGLTIGGEYNIYKFFHDATGLYYFPSNIAMHIYAGEIPVFNLQGTIKISELIKAESILTEHIPVQTYYKENGQWTYKIESKNIAANNITVVVKQEDIWDMEVSSSYFDEQDYDITMPNFALKVQLEESAKQEYIDKFNKDVRDYYLNKYYYNLNTDTGNAKKLFKCKWKVNSENIISIYNKINIENSSIILYISKLKRNIKYWECEGIIKFD